MDIVKEDLQALTNLLQLVSKRAKFPGENSSGQTISEVADVYNVIYLASKLETKLKAIVNTPPKLPVIKKVTRRKPVKETKDATK